MGNDTNNPLESLQDVIKELYDLAYTPTPNFFEDRYELIIGIKEGDEGKADLKELEQLAAKHDLYCGTKIMKEGEDPVAFLRPRKKTS